MIKINVSGRMFETEIKIISRSELFQNIINDVGIPTEPIFINRSPKLFEHVLALLIDPTYPYPIKYINELKYYLIDYDSNKIKINVCGRIFEIHIDTIMKSGLLKQMIDNQDILYINRSPKLFEHVLAFLIDPTYLYPYKYSNELDYYLIEYNHLEDTNEEDILNKVNAIYNHHRLQY